MAGEFEEMGSEDIEQVLEKAKFKHLSDATLISYNDNQLDKTGRALADAHLDLCLICGGQLAILQGEPAARDGYVITESDRDTIGQTVKKLTLQPGFTDQVLTELERLNSYVKDLATAWMALFSRPRMVGTGDGDEVWRYESEDGWLTAWAVLDRKANLAVHFSSPELAWKNFRIRFKLGPFSKEVTLQREGERVTAKIVIPRRERAKKMTDISVEILETQ